MVNPKEEYFQGKGGRKTATARARLLPGKKGVEINGVNLNDYFRVARHQHMIMAPLELVEMTDKVGVSVHVKGSGVSGQAGAVRHSIASALVEYDSELKKKLKKKGFLTRDARSVERKKPGLKKARRRPQWSKR